MSNSLSKSDLVACLSSSCKPRDQWRIGTEHEKLGFLVADTSRPTYPQIRQLLSCLAQRFGWVPVTEGGQVVGLRQEGVNLDFESEADLEEKFRIGLSLQPVVTALFANSPFKDGKPSGYLSWRARAWLDMDHTRSGALPFLFEPGFGFERYAEWALRCPMYFVRRGEVHLDARDQTFEDFMQCGLRGSPGVTATLRDWEAHLGTVWPVVRLKPACLEMRGADCGPWPLICALPALWVGLLYDPLAQQQALELVQGWSQEERDRLREEVPRLALRTPFRSSTVQSLAKLVLEISRGGLMRRGLGEEAYLQPLERIAETGVTHAERLLELYQTSWGSSILPFYSQDYTTASGGPGESRL